MTTTTSMARCGGAPDCFHPVCDCGSIIRLSKHRLHEHPGTVKGSKRTGICDVCRDYGKAQEGTIRQTDFRALNEQKAQWMDHVESLPTVDDRIEFAAPSFYHNYLKPRRADAVPPEGYLFPDEIEELRGQGKVTR